MTPRRRVLCDELTWMPLPSMTGTMDKRGIPDGPTQEDKMYSSESLTESKQFVPNIAGHTEYSVHIVSNDGHAALVTLRDGRPGIVTRPDGMNPLQFQREFPAGTIRHDANIEVF